MFELTDVMTLRKEHRIVGSLMGICPLKPFQVQTKWLPLQLMPEEARLLLDKGIVKLLQSPDTITDPSLIESYFSKRDELCKEQAAILKENRKKEIISKADEIYAGKKRKHLENKVDGKEKTKKTNSAEELSSSDNNDKSSSAVDKSNEWKESPEKSKELSGIEENIDGGSKSSALCAGDDRQELLSQSSCKDDSNVCDSISKEDTKLSDSSEVLDKEKIIETEIAKIPEVNKELCMVQLFTECPWKNMSAFGKLVYPFSETEKLRYAVFRDLWEKGYYITSGLKFGGDFLVYEGDPIKYHAVFIVVCVLFSAKFQALDVLMYGRLGHQVKKTVALASFNESGNVDYISVSWANDLS
ncbi:tRNA-splicing endonuclease subunit Sen34 isoform X2 [Parasteatoda tepidariorum]|uniref:tRNA-splicing endonuclease subunit Sen34 isoform X2 n=1 Tax=Parasteatoda tepidariorum TaxID=114398 RepID=UPI00077F9BAB|nr:tRNA-splicing endonuclease subunit Sen34 isoform X2 [Parasteatoda tepidariorum]